MKVIEKEIVNQQASSILQKKRHIKKIEELKDKRYKLVEAYYQGAIAIYILKGEQVRLVNEIGLRMFITPTSSMKLFQAKV